MVLNWEEVGITLYRGIISLFVLFIITKILGKKQVSQLTLFDYVIGISIGNFAAEMTINLDSEEIYGILAVIEFGLIAYLVSYLTMKSMIIRRIFTGPPTVLVEKGEVIYKNMKKVHFDINDLLQACRIAGYFDLSYVEYALMEANGQVSILPKKDYQNVTIKDMNLKKPNDTLVANLIIDTKVIKPNLENMNKSEEWLSNQLKVKGYQNYNNLLLVTLDENEKMIIYEKKKNKKAKDILD